MKNYRFTILFVLASLLSISALAQSPPAFKYQAVLRDASGAIIASENVTVDVRILKQNAEGVEVFSETHQAQTNEFGIIALQIGSVSSLDDIEWGSDDYFIELTVNGVFMGVTQLLSVPFALHATTSADAFSGDYNDLSNLPDLSGYVHVSNPQAGDMIYYSADGWQPLPLGSEGAVLVVRNGLPSWYIGYLLTVTVDPPNAGIAGGDGEYAAGDQVSLSVVANPHFEFVNWTDEQNNVLSTEETFVYTMPPMNQTVTANFELEEGMLVDIDGNVYETLIAGDQEWMASNLRVTKYRDGTDIPTGLDMNSWMTTTNGAYAIYDPTFVDGIDTTEEMAAMYGFLYNWHTTNEEAGLCPTGWRVPTENDWTVLKDFLIDNYEAVTAENAGNALKSCRQTGSPLGDDCDTNLHPRWNESTTGQYGTDLVKFAGLPAGYRFFYNFDTDIGFTAMWWTSTDTAPNPYGVSLGYNSGEVVMTTTNGKNTGAAIRCIKD